MIKLKTLRWKRIVDYLGRPDLIMKIFIKGTQEGQRLETIQTYDVLEVRGPKWVGRATLLLQVLGGKPVPCLCQLLDTVCIPWLPSA